MEEEQIEKLMRSLKGLECVYKESRWIMLVRLMDYQLGERHLDMQFKIIDYPGFIYPSEESFSASAPWKEMSGRNDNIGFSAVGLVFRLHYNQNLVEKIKERAMQITDLDPGQRFSHLIDMIR